jgi:hypothetical protein
VRASFDRFVAIRRFGALDGLRAVSVIAVVWHHTSGSRSIVMSTADTADHAIFDEKAVRMPLPNRRRLNLIRNTTTTTASPQRQRRHHTQHGTAEHPTRSRRLL